MSVASARSERRSPFTDPQASRRLDKVWIVAAAVACLLTLLYTSWIEVTTHFRLVISDWLDGRIQVDIGAHWYNVLRGREHWNETSYFAPARDTLGYNDGYLLFGLIAVVFRLLGADMFLAFDLSTVVMRSIGFVSYVAFARDALRLRWPACILGAALFTALNNLTDQELHAQLLTVALVPLEAWLLWRGLQAQRAGRLPPAAAFGSAAALVYGIWLLTAYYMAFFFALFTTIFVLLLVSQHVSSRAGRALLVASVMRWPLLVTGAAFLLSVAPFLYVYLPKARETGMHGYPTVAAYLPSVYDLINVGPANVVGRLTLPWLPAFLRSRLADGEQVVGFPPLLLMLGGFGVLSLLFERWPRRAMWRALMVAGALSVALSVHVGHHSLWKLVYFGVPGGRGLRVVCRFFLFLGLPLTLLAVGFLDSRSPRWPKGILVFLGVLLLVEEVNLSPPVGLDRPRELRLLASVPPPPAGCRVFYVRSAFLRPDTLGLVLAALYPHNVDAMTLAEHLALPTVNGFSTFNPPHWDFASVDRRDYLARVQNYLRQTGVRSSVCSVDLAHFTWIDG